MTEDLDKADFFKVPDRRIQRRMTLSTGCERGSCALCRCSGPTPGLQACQLGLPSERHEQVDCAADEILFMRSRAPTTLRSCA
jgi:hypothetical protein